MKLKQVGNLNEIKTTSKNSIYDQYNPMFKITSFKTCRKRQIQFYLDVFSAAN